MTKIPTISEMEELLLRDSKTADLVDGRNAKSKSPDTKLTADQVRTICTTQLQPLYATI